MFGHGLEAALKVRSPVPSKSIVSNTSSQLADGFSEDAHNARYSRRAVSQFSVASLGSTFGDRLRGSVAVSITNDTMLRHIGLQCESTEQPQQPFLSERPRTLSGKLRYYYGKYKLRYFAPFFILLLYSVIGAVLFHYLEYGYEQTLFSERNASVSKLRNETFYRIEELLRKARNSASGSGPSREIFQQYDEELKKILHLTENLEWDMWGAFYYVGTIYTTIGYGNIHPRTVAGKLCTVIYALVGIPLVLAILSQSGQALSRIVSTVWMRYQGCVKDFAKKRQFENGKKFWRTWRFRKRDAIGRDIMAEEGKANEKNESSRSEDVESVDSEDEEVKIESRTIPIWLALFICFAWICTCAGLFCLWEKRWSYDDSLYFFFVSLSTIGLGDVVPDHPHVLIVMFLLVIVGLSLVSMLLSVMQIKIEEFLYRLAIKLRKEYKKALASGDPAQAQALLERVMETEPWWSRNVAAQLMSERQAAEIEHQAEKLERSVRVVNNRNMQTDESFLQSCAIPDEPSIVDNSMASVQDIVTEAESSYKTTLESNRSLLERSVLREPLQTKNGTAKLYSAQGNDSDSLSEATSIPVDLITNYLKDSGTNVYFTDTGIQGDAVSLEDRSQQIEDFIASNRSVQTDIGQFELDEIKLRLLDLQSQPKPLLLESRAVVTSPLNSPSLAKKITPTVLENKFVQCQLFPTQIDQCTATAVCVLLDSSSETDRVTLVETATGTEALGGLSSDAVEAATQATVSFRDQAVSAASPAHLVDIGTETDRKIYLDQLMGTRSLEASTGDFGTQVTDLEFSTVDPEVPSCSTVPQTVAAKQDSPTATACGMWFHKKQNTQGTETEKLRVKTRSTQCQLWRKKTCEEATQTIPEPQQPAPKKVRPKKPLRTSLSISTETENFPDRVMKDLIVQTDDSYLKIARRLDEIRCKRTGSLHVCAAKPLFARNADTNASADPHFLLLAKQNEVKASPAREPLKRKKSFMQRMDKLLSPKSLRSAKLQIKEDALLEESTAEAQDNSSAQQRLLENTRSENEPEGSTRPQAKKPDSQNVS